MQHETARMGEQVALLPKYKGKEGQTQLRILQTLAVMRELKGTSNNPQTWDHTIPYNRSSARIRGQKLLFTAINQMFILPKVMGAQT
jgi:hypothetical protein